MIANSDKIQSITIPFKNINFVVSTIFFIVIIHNLLNYVLNNMDEIILENKKNKKKIFFCDTLLFHSKMELIFFIVMTIFIVLGFFCFDIKITKLVH